MKKEYVSMYIYVEILKLDNKDLPQLITDDQSRLPHDGALQHMLLTVRLPALVTTIRYKSTSLTWCGSVCCHQSPAISTYLGSKIKLVS